jgi:hypothetical protein
METYFRIMDNHINHPFALPDPPPRVLRSTQAPPVTTASEKILEDPGFTEHPVYGDPPDVPRNPDLPR